MMTPTFSAMDTALAIPELLEGILVRVDMATLLISATRVCRAWRDLISDSPSLQRALFFLPDEDPASVRSRHGTEYSLEHLLSLSRQDDEDLPGYLGSSSQDDEKLPDGQASSGLCRAPWPGALNPLLLKKFGPCFFDFGENYGYVRRADSFYAMPWASATPRADADAAWARVTTADFVDPEELVSPGPGPEWAEKHKARLDRLHAMVRAKHAWAAISLNPPEGAAAARRRFTRGDASWRRMLVAQPPVHQLGLIASYDGHSFTDDIPTGSVVLPRSGPPGLRMAELYDVVQEYAGHHDSDSVGFRVLWGMNRRWRSDTQFARSVRQGMLDAWVMAVEVSQSTGDERGLLHREPRSKQVFDSVFRCEGYMFSPYFSFEWHWAPEFEPPSSTSCKLL